MTRHAVRQPRRPWGVAVALTAVAGCVDAVGYVMLAHVFVANMSGNSVAVGLDAAGSRWGEVWHRGWSVVTFVAGLLVGGVVAETQRRRRGARRAVAVTLLLECALLAGFLAAAGATFGWHAHGPVVASDPGWPTPRTRATALLVALAAGAMGVQNVCLRVAGALSVYTTHVTGSLTQLADEAVTYGLWLRDRARRRRGRDTHASSRARRWRRLMYASRRHPSGRELAFLVGLWAAYVAGAAAGGLALGRWGAAAVLGPLIVLAAVTAGEFFGDRSGEMSRVASDSSQGDRT